MTEELKTSIRGRKVIYEKRAAKGIDYLRNDLDSAEARVFFDQARMRGSAPFEDDNDRQFTLIYKSSTYFLKRR